MKITDQTKIKYTLQDKNGELIYLTFPLECVEGSTPNFYAQLRQAVSDLEEFDIDSSEIIDREIIEETKDESNSN